MAKETRVEQAAAALAWGQSVDDTAKAVGVERQILQKWMRKEEFQAAWNQRFQEYIRYLQGPSVAFMERQLFKDDDKAGAAAAASLIKLGDQLESEGGDGMKVSFMMPMPGEPENRGEEEM